MTKLTWEQEEILTLRDRVAELEEELLQLREQQKPVLWFPVEWALQPSEQRLLHAIYAAPGGRLTREGALSAIAVKEDVMEPLVGVILHRLRKKIKPLGIEIITRWRQGFEMPAASRAIIKKAIAAGSDAT